MGEKKQKQGFLKTGSIDDIFSGSFEKKEKAVRLLSEKRQLDYEELGYVAEAVYETTFARLFDADYSVRRSAKHRKEEIGAECKDVDKILDKEVCDYVDIDNDRLARPAWWFASNQLWTMHLETNLLEMTGLNGNPEKSVRDAFERYKKGFEDKKVYLVSNLKIILGYEDGS